jgi:hypothetical protein
VLNSANLSSVLLWLPFSGGFLWSTVPFLPYDGIAFSSLTGIAGGLRIPNYNKTALALFVRFQKLKTFDVMIKRSLRIGGSTVMRYHLDVGKDAR